MIDEARGCELLEDGLEHATRVAVTVRRAEYRCCGGGWHTRASDEGLTFTGRVLSINVDSFLLECDNDLGKRAEVIAGFSDLVHVEPLVD